MSNSNTLELVQPDVISQELEKANITPAIIAGLKERYMSVTINGIEDKAGYKLADEARKNCKTMRVMATKVCKAGREEAVKIQKDWIAKEKEVTGEIELVEAHLEAELKKVDDAKEAIRIEEERRQQEMIQNRVKQLMGNGCSFDGSVYSINGATISHTEVAMMQDSLFIPFLETAKAKYKKLLAEKAEAERLQKEEEERQRKEREEFEAKKKVFEAEQARIAKENEEREAKIKADQDRIAKEQQDRENAIKAEQEKLDAEKKRIEDERIAKEREEQHQKELAEAREKAAEEARLKAIQDAENEKGRIAKEAEDARIEAERLAALAPDKEKLVLLMEAFAAIMLPTVNSEKATAIVDNVRSLNSKIQDYISKQIKSL